MPGETMLVLDPTARANLPEREMASRVDSLEGKVVGILYNFKPNADLILERIEEILSKKFAVKEVVRRSKSDAASGARQEVLDELADRCDLVINGVGD
jgi:hypothetical protein